MNTNLIFFNLAKKNCYLHYVSKNYDFFLYTCNAFQTESELAGGPPSPSPSPLLSGTPDILEGGHVINSHSHPATKPASQPASEPPSSPQPLEVSTGHQLLPCLHKLRSKMPSFFSINKAPKIFFF